MGNWEENLWGRLYSPTARSCERFWEKPFRRFPSDKATPSTNRLEEKLRLDEKSYTLFCSEWTNVDRVIYSFLYLNIKNYFIKF
jgi:hypothetical protein